MRARSAYRLRNTLPVLSAQIVRGGAVPRTPVPFVRTVVCYWQEADDIGYR